jgi:hypothetical protein
MTLVLQQMCSLQQHQVQSAAQAPLAESPLHCQQQHPAAAAALLPLLQALMRRCCSCIPVDQQAQHWLRS